MVGMFSCILQGPNICRGEASGEAELYAACPAAERAVVTRSMARRVGVHLSAIIGRQELGRVRHWDLSYLWLQAVVLGKQVIRQKVESENNMVLERWRNS